MTKPTIGDAVRHALTHVESIQRDAGRLQKRNGCCVPTPGETVGMACCAPRDVVAEERRA